MAKTLDATDLRLNVWMARLRKQGVSKIVTDFDGEGDSGSIQGHRLFGRSGKEFIKLELEEPYKEQLEQYYYTLLPGGWEINEGAFGEIGLDLATGKITMTVNMREISISTDVKEFELGAEPDGTSH